MRKRKAKKISKVRIAKPRPLPKLKKPPVRPSQKVI
jgi:hypothetical protein